MASPPLYIVGAGAVGLHLAARLSAITPVTVVARGPRAARLAREGFDLAGAEQGHFALPVVDIADPLPASAELLIAVKSTQLRETLHQLRPGPQHTLGLCQTGLGVAAMARALAPTAARVRLGCWIAAGLATPTTVRVAGIYQVELAADDPEALRTRDRWQRLLASAGYPVRVVSSVAACEWRKALLNLAVNGLCATLGERTGAVVDSPPLHALAREILQEARSVAAAEGVRLTDEDIERVFTSATNLRNDRSTMLQDVTRGEATEMQFLNLAVARLAVKHGLFAPVNAVVARLVEHCERRRPDPGPSAA
ncbi:MAG TPA: 2-dehydropantoate 2-reductase [Nannocystis sp.]|jgi:2-dehydropantoate 2-reductase